MRLAILTQTIGRATGPDLQRTNLLAAGIPQDQMIALVGLDGPDVPREVVPRYWTHNAHVFVGDQKLGCAAGLNELLRIAAHGARPDFFCVVDDDIALPDGWAAALIAHHAIVAGDGWVPGVSSFLIEGQKGVETVCTCRQYWPRRHVIGGVRFFSALTQQALGYFCEDYGLYGFDDCDFGDRAHRTGRLNYYVTVARSRHLGATASQGGITKTKVVQAAREAYRHNVALYSKGERLFQDYIPKDVGLIKLQNEGGN